MQFTKCLYGDDIDLLIRFGILVQDMTVDRYDMDNTIRGTFILKEDVFRPMCHLIRIVDMINESKNPAIQETFGHLIEMLELSKK